jgi:hypothetical protein
MQEIIGNSKLVRQTFDEFLSQKVEEINSGKNEQEKGAILNQLFSSEFKELIDLEAELKKTYDEFGLEASQLQAQEQEVIKRIVEFSQEKQRLKESGNPEAKNDIGILDMYGRIYRRKEEVLKRLSEISNKMHNEGTTDLNSHYYITKRLLEKFNETGKLSEEAVKFAITPKLIKAYEANFETGKAVTFLANHGTPNHELMVSKTFNTDFLGRNTGSMSAFNATFFAGSKETSVNYVGNPIAKTWVRDFIQARKYYVNNFSPELKAKLESLLSSDTSKGVVQKVNALMANAHIEFPNDFKLKDTGRKTKEGEPIIKPSPETQQGWDIDGFLDRALEGANDEGFAIGGYEMAWKEEGRKPYLLRNIVKMDNPLVHEYAKADYRDETFASVIRRAKEAGHDGVIFKNTKDGGGLDTIFASFAKNEDNKIFTLETSEDTRFVPRGNDEAGNKVKNGSEIEGRNYQPTEAPLVDAVEMAEARRLGDLFKTKQMREFVGDRKVVPQTADEGFTDFINNFKQADINQDTALMMLDEMSKDMFGGLDRQTNRLRLNELKEKAMVAFEKANPKMKGLYGELPDRRIKEYLPLSEYIEAKRLEESLAKPAPQKQLHSEFTGKTAKEFAKKIEEARKWVKKANPQYNDFSGYLADNVPMREYYQHAVYSKKFKTGEPVVVVGVHGTNTSQGFLRDRKFKHELRVKDLPLSDGERRGAYFASSDSTVLNPEYQGYDPKKVGYEFSPEFRRPESDSPNIGKSAIRFDNPLVVDGQQTPMMKRTEKILGEAIEKGHDGVIYINQMDGGNLDVSFILPVETANKQQRMIGSTLEKTMAGEAYEPLPRGEGLTNRTAYLQPDEPMPPSRDQGFNRVYREISRSKKASTRSIKEAYINKWGIDLSDFEKHKQLTDALDRLERDAEDGKDIPDFIFERRDLKKEIEDLESWMDSRITETQGDYARQFTDQLDEIEIGMSRIDSIISTISEQPLSKVGTWSGTNRLDAVLTRELGSGFAREISGDDVFIADAFREFAGQKYERDMIGKAFESELYSSDYITPQKGRHHYTIPASEGANKKGILIDILKSENKLTKEGKPQGEVNPRRIINALRNRSGGDSKVYAEAKAIGLIDWLESKQEGKNQKKVTTKELIEFVENNKMGLEIDPQLEQAADFGNTRPYVTGGEEQAKKGYRVYVVRMTNANHEHRVAGHFEGAVVHVRVTLRDSKDGKKVMHIEEIQANNTATDVLSESQRQIVTKEIQQLKLFKKDYEAALLYTQAESSALKSRFTASTTDYATAETARVDRWQNKRDTIAKKYAESLYDLNPEEYQERYTSIGNKTRDGYISALAKSLLNSRIDMMVSEKTTRLNAKKNNAPLQDPKEWVKVAFRTVLRKAFVEGVDRITITPWSETPLQVGMKSKSAERFYGKTIVDAFNSELQKMNSRLDVENKSTSKRQARITEANVRLNDAIQRVAKEVDVRAENNGADIAEIFKYLHMSDADLDNRFGSQSNNYMSSAFNFEKWMQFETGKLPNDYKGLDAIEKAVSARTEKLTAYIEEEMSNQGAKTPSGKKVAAGSMSESEYLVDRSMGFNLTPEMKKKAARPQRMFQPAEYSEFKSEQSATGRILRNAKGYVIMLANNKFRVYNPAKAIIGVYGSEEEAKKRIYKEIPKQ